jgi:spermidine synthase
LIGVDSIKKKAGITPRLFSWDFYRKNKNKGREDSLPAPIATKRLAD